MDARTSARAASAWSGSGASSETPATVAIRASLDLALDEPAEVGRDRNALSEGRLPKRHPGLRRNGNASELVGARHGYNATRCTLSLLCQTGRRRRGYLTGGGGGCVAACMALKSRKMRRARWRLSARRRFGAALALGAAAGDVVARAGVDAGLGERDHVQGGVELAVAGAVEPVAALLARGGVERRGAGVDGQLGVGAEALDLGRSRRAAGRR